MADLRYEVSFKGVASVDIRAAFGDCEADTGRGITTVRCPKEGLNAVVNRIEDLGLGSSRSALWPGAHRTAGRERDGGDRAAARDLRGWSILSGWLAARNVSGRIVFLLSGPWSPTQLGVVTMNRNSTVHVLAELDPGAAALHRRVDVPLAAARQDLPLTARLLGIGLPLTILAGTGVAVLVFPSLPLALAGLIAASLARPHRRGAHRVR